MQGLTHNLHGTRAGRYQPGHQRQPGRLAAARGATEQQHGALRHIDIGKLQHRRVGGTGVLVRQTLGTDHAAGPAVAPVAVAPVAQSAHTPRTAKSRCMSW